MTMIHVPFDIGTRLRDGVDPGIAVECGGMSVLDLPASCEITLP